MPINDPPVASNDVYIISDNSTLTVDASYGLLANDNDEDNDILTARLVIGSGPRHGTLTLNPDGSFSYSPDGSVAASDSFAYVAYDGAADSNVATVTIINAGIRVTTGQLVLYTFKEGQGATINDVSGVGTPLNLTVDNEGATSWLAEGGLAIDSSTIISSTAIATKVIDAVKASNEITIEAWLKPANASQTGPARIVTLSENHYGRDFTLGQNANAYEVRLRTAETNGNGTPSLTSPSGSLTTQLTHVVYTRDNLELGKLYVNGSLVITEVVSGDFSSWDNYEFALANELTNDRPWLGEFHLVAVFNRALEQKELLQNFLAGLSSNLNNHPPIAMNDAYSVDEGGTLAVEAASGVLNNDSDEDGDSFSAFVINEVSHGELTLNSDGSFVYTHDGSESIYDSFSYVANAGRGGTDTATVSITVVPTNDPPLARNDSYYVTEGGTISINLDGLSGILANDSDPDNDTLTASLLDYVNHGALTLNPDGSFTYNHDGSKTKDDSFTYIASDGNSTSNAATVSFIIKPLTYPTVTNNDDYIVDEGGTLTVSAASGLLANDAALTGGSLTASLVSGSRPSNGNLILRADGAFTYTHNGSETNEASFAYVVGDGALTYLPEKDFNGTDTFSLKLDDSGAPTSIVNVTVPVTAVNDAPKAMNETIETGEDYAVGVILPANDIDGDVLTYSVLDQPSHGNLLGAAPTLIYTPHANYCGLDRFTFKVNDGQVDSNIATVTITILADSDENGMPDDWEAAYGVNDPYADPDGDGLINRVEFLNGTDPLVNNQSLPDTDGDGIPDMWEESNGLDPGVDDAAADPDSDGLTNQEEYLNGTNPFLIDSDGDSIGDITEVALATNPRDPNSVPVVSLVTSNLWVTDVTPRSFSLVWKSNESATCSANVYGDADGTRPIAGLTISDESSDHPPAGDVGVMKVNISGLNPDTTYYFQLVTVSGTTVLVEPANGELPSVRTEVSSAPVSNDLLAQQILQDDGISSADGGVLIAEVEGGSYPVTGWVGEGISSPWAYVDLNNIYSLNESTNLQLVGDEDVTLWSFGGVEGDYVNTHEIPAPTGIIQAAVPDASHLSKESGIYLELRIDLNIVGLPVYSKEGFTAYGLLLYLAEQAGGDSTAVESIRRFARGSGSWETASWFLGQPAGVDFPIEPGEAYLIYMGRDLDDVWFEGVAVGVAVNLSPGLNLVCLPAPREGFKYGSHEMLEDLGDQSEVQYIKRYDSTYGWQTTSWFLGSPSGALYDTRKGEGYVIYMNEARQQWRPY
jgi:VCBS repeat-containing protein